MLCCSQYQTFFVSDCWHFDIGVHNLHNWSLTRCPGYKIIPVGEICKMVTFLIVNLSYLDSTHSYLRSLQSLLQNAPNLLATVKSNMFENGCSVWDNSHSVLYVNMLLSIVEMIISLSMSKSEHERQKERALYNTVLIYGYVNKAR